MHVKPRGANLGQNPVKASGFSRPLLLRRQSALRHRPTHLRPTHRTRPGGPVRGRSGDRRPIGRRNDVRRPAFSGGRQPVTFSRVGGASEGEIYSEPKTLTVHVICRPRHRAGTPAMVAGATPTPDPDDVIRPSRPFFATFSHAWQSFFASPARTSER